MTDVSGCGICGETRSEIVYLGPVRHGSFGSLSRDDAEVRRCAECGAGRLSEDHCADEDLYETEEYRRLLAEPTDAAGFLAGHDSQQLRNLIALWPESVRGATVADLGCAAGSFLDHISGVGDRAIAVEPCAAYHESLMSRGYEVFSYADEASKEIGPVVDFGFALSVIEHVRNPRKFLEDALTLVRPGGRMLVSTPNWDDILMELLPEDYAQFFYRTVHRWYFDRQALERCATIAGFDVLETKVVHRFGISNTMAWLRDRRPTGDSPLPHVASPILDRVWQAYLEDRGVGDYLYMTLQRN